MKKVLAGFTVFFSIISISLWFFLFTEKGLQILVHSGQDLSKGKLQIDRAAGKIGKNFSLSGFTFEDGGLSVQVNRVKVSWNIQALLRGEFQLIDFSAAGVKLSTTAEEKTAQNGPNSFSLPDIALPLTIVIKRILIEDIEIVSGSNPVTRIDRVELEVEGQEDKIKINTLFLKGHDFEIDLSGSIGTQKGWPAEIRGRWNVKPAGFERLTGTCSLLGSVEKGRLVVDIVTPVTSSLRTDYSLSEVVKWSSTFVGNGVKTEIFQKDLPGKLDVEIAVNGKFEKGDVATDINIRKIEGVLAGYPVLMQSKARFANGNLNITEAVVKSGESELIVKGVVARDLDLNFYLSSPNIAEIFPQLSGSIEARGTVHGGWQRPLVEAEIQGGNITAGGAKVSLLSASVDAVLYSEGNINAKIALKDIQKGKTHLEEAVLQLSGGIENHQIQLRLMEKKQEFFLEAGGAYVNKNWSGEVRDVLFSLDSVDPVHLENSAQLQISAKKALLDNMCLLHDKGKMCLDGQWQEDKWQATVELSDVDPALFFKDFPGNINGKLTGYGDFSQNGGGHHIQLKSLSGDLNGEAISGGGQIQIAKGNLNCEELFFQLGKAKLTVEGAVGDTFNLKYSGEIPDLEEIIPKTGGSFSLDGSLMGDRDVPVLNLNFEAKEGVFGKNSLKQMSGNVTIDLRPTGNVKSNIIVSGISTGVVTIDDGKIEVGGSAKKHEFKLALSTSVGELMLQGEGGYDSYWSGSLSSLSVEGDYGQWNLEGNPQVMFGAEDNRIKDFCLQGDKAEMCLTASLDADKNWGFGVDVTSLSLSLLNDFSIFKPPLEGSFQGKIVAEGQANIITALQMKSSVPHLVIGERTDEGSYSYLLRQNSLSLYLKDGTLNCQLQSQLQENSSFIGKVRLAGANDLKTNFATLPVDGEVVFDIEDLTLVNILTDSKVRANGKVMGELALSGILAKPAINGDLELQDGGVVEIPGLGISIKDLALKVDAGNDVLNFDYSGKSGQGEILGKGSYLYGVNGLWRVNTDLTGTDFDLLATEEFKIRVDPDLHLEIDRDGGRLWGELTIPYARIATLSGSGTVSPSDDVVIVDELDSQQQKKQLFSTDITITLGDDVTIDAFGLKSYLTGKLELINPPKKTLTAIGELVVKDGKFALYGVALDINRGRLLFAGGLIDNPGVDFQAQRKIEKKVVGINVSGTVNDLDVQLFSDPVMEESDILAHILVGKSIISSSDDDQSLIGTAALALGIGGANKIFGKLGEYIPIDEIYLDGGKKSEDISLVVGKNLTKDLFIGYDHNFFDSTGDLKVNYTLGGGFSIETKSSAAATSGDIIYSIDR